jgi:hypothetical protein
VGKTILPSSSNNNTVPYYSEAYIYKNIDYEFLFNYYSSLYITEIMKIGTTDINLSISLPQPLVATFPFLSLLLAASRPAVSQIQNSSQHPHLQITQRSTALMKRPPHCCPRETPRECDPEGLGQRKGEVRWNKKNKSTSPCAHTSTARSGL